MSPAGVTIAGAILNVLLSVFKLLVGMGAGSAALVADGWHSFSDLVSDALCWASCKLGALPPDASHPNGYGRYEHYATLGIAAMLFATGATMVLSSSRALLALLRMPMALCAARAPLSAIDIAALGVALASVVTKELLFGVTHAIGLRCQSPTIIANAYHHRSDALSSLVAIAGIFGGLCGFGWLDPLAATAVGLMVTAMGCGVAKESMDALRGEDDESHESGVAAAGGEASSLGSKRESESDPVLVRSAA